MVDIIKALTAPLIPPARRCFDKAANYITAKHPGISPAHITHDLKALMFDATSVMMVNMLILAYLKTITLVTAVAGIAFFYLVRRIIDQTEVPLPPSPARASLLGSLTSLSRAAIGQNQPKTLADDKTIKSPFIQGDNIIIWNVVILRLTHYPLPKMIGMIFTRN